MDDDSPTRYSIGSAREVNDALAPGQVRPGASPDDIRGSIGVPAQTKRKTTQVAGCQYDNGFFPAEEGCGIINDPGIAVPAGGLSRWGAGIGSSVSISIVED